MNSAIVTVGIVHLLLIGCLAALPKHKLVHPRLETRLALGLFCGLASLLVAVQGGNGPEFGVHNVHPSLVASAAFLWGPGAGALAALTAMAAGLFASTPAWTQTIAIAACSVAAGGVWWLAQRHARVPAWGAVAGLALSLPLALLPLAGSASSTAVSSWDWLLTLAPWRYLLGILVLSGVATLLVGRARTQLTLEQREQDLMRALRASGGGRWEWHVDGQRLFYAGQLYRRFGLSHSPHDSGGALVDNPLSGRQWWRWSRERCHPEDLHRLKPYLRHILAGHEYTLQAEFRMRDDDGQWRWLTLRGHAVQHDAQGRVQRMSGMYLDITEHREIREKLEVTQVKYATVYQTLPDAAGITRLHDGLYLDINSAFERLFALSRNQVVGHTSIELGIWGDASERERLLTQLRSQGEVRGLPMTAYRAGDPVHGIMSARVTQIEGEACMVFVFHDMTHEQRVREELLATNSLLRQAGWMARLGIWEEVPGQGLTYWSDVCFDIHGLQAGSPLPRDYVDTFIAPEWREQMRQQMRQSLRQHTPWHMETQILRADGRRLWVRVRGEPVVQDGRVAHVRGILQDIDAMRRATEELRATEERLLRVFQLLPTPLGFSRHEDGRYLDVNPAWEQVLGFTREEALGRSAMELGIFTAAQRAALIEAAGPSGDLVGYELDITDAHGKSRTVLQSLSAVQMHGEQCWLFAMHDITERKQTEQRVREREELLSLTLSAAALGLWDWDLAAGTITGDARWRDMLALAPQAPDTAVPWTVALAQVERGVVAQELARHLDEPGQPFDITCKVAAEAAGERWIRCLGKVVAWSGDGEPLRLVGMAIDVTGQRTHEQQLERMAHYDALTGLANRVLLERRMREGMHQSDAHGTQMGVAYLDLDGFKPINDRFGHATGDQLLVLVAERLRRALRRDDCVARLGGDEFVLLLQGLPDRQACEQRMRTLMQSIGAPYLLGEEKVLVTASVGYTIYPDDSADADTLLRHADQAMYVAKQAGRNRYHTFDAAHERARQTQRGERERLAQALDHGELVLYLQPKVDMRLGVVEGAEALARWEHPQRGVLPPAQFLPLIEGDAQLQALFGEWVVDEALRLIGRLMHEGMALPVSINITPQHLHREGFADWLTSRMALHPHVPARLVHLELTESAALYDIEHAARELAQLRALGVGVSFDDFGTGYSSLAYLRRLRVDHLKLDRSFVDGMLDDAGDRAIVQGVIGLGRSFGCETIAEGVETVEQGRLLLQMGCHLAQGYCIARPMPAAQFAPWARQWQPPAQWCEEALVMETA